MYVERFEEIVQYFNEHFPDELTRAREEFFGITGEIFEEDPFFEQRISNFLEWFVFDRRLNGGSRAIDHYTGSDKSSNSTEDRETLAAFGDSLHSLFEVRRIAPKKELVVLKDLSDRVKYSVTERRSLIGLEKGNIIEVRLISRNDRMHFLEAFVHHPQAANPKLRKLMKQFRKSDREDLGPLLLSLQKCWMKCQRYGHLDPKQIYAEVELEEIYGA